MTEFRGRLRISGKDVDGNLPTPKAISKILGIGLNMADNIAIIASRKLKIQKNEKIGNLSDAQIKEIEKIIEDPLGNGVPEWSVNRRDDPFTKETKHIVEVDYKLQHKFDSEHEKETRTYRGIRYMFNLPVRGQRTKTSGRHGKTMGVTRKKQQPAAAKKPAAQASAKGKGKKK